MMRAPERLLAVREVAEWLGVSEAWVRDHCGRKRPHLPVVRLGRVLRFREEDIERFILELKEGRAA
jgi:excisionase family DNA binding protein